MNRLARALLPAALAVPLALVGCSSETTELPAGLGPLAIIGDLAWPAACEGAGATGSGIALGAARPVIASPAYNEMKARACVPFPLADVWQALQIPSGVQVAFWPERDVSDCAPAVNVEPGYAVSFSTEEIPHGAIESHFTFVLTWRAVAGGITAFERGNPLFKDIGGRVHQAGVDVAQFLEREQICSMFRAFELITGGLVQRHRATARGGVGGIARV